MYEFRRRGAYIIAIAFVASVVAAIFSGNPTTQELRAVPSETVLVKFVVDGDTLDIESGERVRLIGIDTPERGESGYEDAKVRLEELTLGKRVTLETDTSDRDKYRRLLRYVYVGELFINEVMVREGLAKQFPFGDDRKFQGLIDEAEKSAKAEGLGIWK